MFIDKLIHLHINGIIVISEKEIVYKAPKR